MDSTSPENPYRSPNPGKPADAPPPRSEGEIEAFRAAMRQFAEWPGPESGVFLAGSLDLATARAALLDQQRFRFTWGDGLFVALLLALGAWVAYGWPDGLGAGIVPGALLVGTAAIYGLLVYLRYRQQQVVVDQLEQMVLDRRGLFGYHEVLITGEGVCIKTPQTISKQQWENFDGYRAADDYIALSQRDTQSLLIHIFPRSMCRHDDDWRQVVNLVKAHVKAEEPE